MLALLQDIWSRLQPGLRGRVGEAAYAAWLEGLRPLALERSVVYVEARSRLACERVQRLYQPLLEDLLSDEFGTRVQVNVLPAPESLVPNQLEVGPTRPMVDGGNRTAVLMLRALASEDRRQVLPAELFVLYGAPGVGKTFLLRWFAAELPQRPLYLTGDELTKAVQAAARERRVAGLTEELAAAPYLVVDEVHRIGGRDKVQAALLRILQARVAAGRPTVLASRWHPKEIWKLQPGLCSTLLSGFVAAIDFPGLEARLGYLRALEGPAARNGLAGAVEQLAREVRGGYRDLRRAWLAQRQDLGPQVRSRYLQLLAPRATFDRLLGRVCERLEVAADQLLGPSQTRSVSFARQVLAHLCVVEGLSRAEVGRFLGGRSRAAISYAIKALHRRMAQSDAVRRQVAEVAP